MTRQTYDLICDAIVAYEGKRDKSLSDEEYNDIRSTFRIPDESLFRE